MFHINCFTSIYFLSTALLNVQKVTGFVVTVVWCIQYDVLHSCVGVLLTDHVTNSMEQIPYFGADFWSSGQEISCLVWDRNVIYCQQDPTAVTFAIWIRSALPHHILFFPENALMLPSHPAWTSQVLSPSHVLITMFIHILTTCLLHYRIL